MDQLPITVQHGLKGVVVLGDAETQQIEQEVRDEVLNLLLKVHQDMGRPENSDPIRLTEINEDAIGEIKRILGKVHDGKRNGTHYQFALAIIYRNRSNEFNAARS